ncbi:hypothetical protein Z949_2869 [Sulfitobacter guttiformis KCTC 32187]|nr:hypothetical protein Z949_2869 [Sulfitobacter guttiformis KCTC 32187]
MHAVIERGWQAMSTLHGAATGPIYKEKPVERPDADPQ